MREQYAAEIDRQDLEEVAGAVGRMPIGVKSLFAYPHWRLETALPGR